MDIAMYEQILMRRIVLFSILCIVVIIVSVGAILWNRHDSKCAKKTDETDKAPGLEFTTYFIYFLCVGIILGSVVLGTITVSECVYDIKNKAYVVWNGEFTVGGKSSGNSIWYLPDEKGIKLEGDNLAKGQYTGMVIYGEKSIIVLEYDIAENSK